MFIVPVNTADGKVIIASLQRLLKCRVEHLLINYASKYLFKLYCICFVYFSPCNQGGTLKFLSICYVVSVHIVMAVHNYVVSLLQNMTVVNILTCGVLM